MKSRPILALTIIFLFAALILSACGSKAVEISELPAYPNATALQPGDDPVADTLANNASQDAAVRGNLGIGGSTKQQAFRLPENTDWNQVKSFFDGELDSAGWEKGLGGIAGNIAGDVLETANAGNELVQTAMFSKGKQTLTIMRIADATNPSQPYLILSLSTN